MPKQDSWQDMGSAVYERSHAGFRVKLSFHRVVPQRFRFAGALH